MSQRFWAVFWLLNLSSGGDCQRNASLLSSVSDAVRMGATIVSGILNSRRSDFMPSALRKLRERLGGTEEGQTDEAEGEGEAMVLLMRLLGMDSKRVKKIAFEGFISLLHLMSQVLVPGGRPARKNKTSDDFSLLRFVLSRPQVADLLSRMQDSDLVEEVLQESRRKLKDYPAEEVQCLQLLTCKTKPFVRGMQRSLRFFMKRENVTAPVGQSDSSGEEDRRLEEEAAKWEEAGLEDRMYFFVPSLREVLEHGDRCDELFPHCIY